MAHIQTVLGPLDPAQAGRVLHHEHLLALTPGPWLSGGRPPGSTSAELMDADWAHDQVDQGVRALSGLGAYGIGTVVDLSPYGVVGRDDEGTNVALLQEISRGAGVHVVSGTAVYLESFSPPWAVQASLKEMTDKFISDATIGIGGTSARAGILGEQATGLGVITPHEEKCLRAAARAHLATGLALSTHTTHGTMAMEQVQILRQEGVDLSSVVIGHMDTHPDFDYVQRVIDTGVNIAFDTIGKQYWDYRVDPLPPDQPEGPFSKSAYLRTDSTRAERIGNLVGKGYVSQILLSQDLTGEEVYLNRNTHGQYGYSYLPGPFTGLLHENGVTDGDMETMLSTNPARILTIA